MLNLTTLLSLGICLTLLISTKGHAKVNEVNEALTKEAQVSADDEQGPFSAGISIAFDIASTNKDDQVRPFVPFSLYLSYKSLSADLGKSLTEEAIPQVQAYLRIKNKFTPIDHLGITPFVRYSINDKLEKPEYLWSYGSILTYKYFGISIEHGPEQSLGIISLSLLTPLTYFIESSFS